MVMATIASLPVELLFMVIEEAKYHKGLKTLRCVNKLLCELVEPILFETVVFDSKSKLGSSLEMLCAVSDSDSQRSRPIGLYVQCLIIRCFGRVFSGPRTLSSNREDDSDLLRKMKPDEIQREFDERLLKALGSLKRLKSVQVFSGFDCLSPSSLWSSLLTHHISLTSLIVWAKTEKSLLDYLNSYSGIKELRIHRAWVSSDTTVDRELAEYFVETVLPRHQQTLRDLTVTAAEEGPWAAARWNSEQYEVGEELRSLEVSVNSEEVGPGAEEDAVTSILSVAHRLRNLRCVSFCTADSRRWGSSWGWLSQQHEPHTIALITQRVLNFGIPQDSQRESPNVEVDGQVYKPKLGEDGDFRYSPTMSEEEAKIRRWRQQKAQLSIL
ncbi:hypothetical protein E1B28_006864 [Marasmius oreades]|uniref:F-box domain-containing protein n=1 Tax=Marasmius oreades TaxID=181124 RepID=A0A9P7S154_9AGAR|nr:uncharacterized protein E1B28_006864 [Marasmius oreades]KAG7093175.1 hypothetical protein E1B28_006864 [Marasmius oreades]